MTYTTKELADCLRREIAMRRRVYGRRVSEGTMDPDQAAKEVAMMLAVLEIIQSQEQPKLL
jgi:hypothetical protein